MPNELEHVRYMVFEIKALELVEGAFERVTNQVRRRSREFTSFREVIVELIRIRSKTFSVVLNTSSCACEFILFISP